MMYQKSKPKKKRKKHKASILHQRDGTCYLCMREGIYKRYSFTHEHHIFGGANRQNSEAEGLKVYLCLEHHTAGSEAVHNNKKNMNLLREEGQRAYERNHTRAEFMELIGRNYLDEEAAVEEKRNEEPGFIFLEESEE